MKFTNLGIRHVLILLTLILICTGLKTNSNSKLMSKSQTNAKTRGKTSIFSYDFLSVMKKKLKLLKEKEKFDEQSNDKLENNNEISIEKTNIQNTIHETSTQNVKTSGAIYFSGWAKYFKFKDSDPKAKPNSFFKNNYFFEQRKFIKPEELAKKPLSPEIVPNSSSWWVSLFKDTLTISGSKKDSSLKLYDSLNLDLIQPMIEGKGFTGGLIDFGSFSEGFCFKLALVTHHTWILCTETNEDKMKLMNAIKNLKLQKQKDKGQVLVRPEVPKEESLANVLGGKTDDSSKPIEGHAKVNDLKDGYWIVLQDWSQCSKKCDGGVSTLHRMCVPPKNGGKACEGEAVVTKPCNTNPCPKVESTKNDPNSKNKPVTLKPIVKIMPYSTRPQRYHKCIIKETDLMMTKLPENEPSPQTPNKFSHPVQIPVRAVLNNRTLSFYENAEDYSTHFTSYNLKTSDFFRSKRNKNCFIITEGQKQTELCPFGLDSSGKTYTEWDRDYHLFKFNCETKTEEISFDEKLKEKLNEKINSAKRELLEEREEEIKHKMEQKDVGIIKQTQKIAQQAIIKELNLEELIQKEEEEKEKRQEMLLLEEIEKEKKKNECVMHAIKEREIENQYHAKTKETELEVEGIKKEAMNEVLMKRNKLKEKIAEMRKQAMRREAKLKQKLQGLRMNMAKKMTDIYRDGDQNKCAQGIKDEQFRVNYCTANFDDFVKFSECKDTDEFCNFCCENEFGQMHIDHRNKCIKEVCEIKSKEQKDAQGKWIWANSLR